MFVVVVSALVRVVGNSGDLLGGDINIVNAEESIVVCYIFIRL